MKTDYALKDGRYYTDPDRAITYEYCDTLEEARKEAKEYGDDTAIVKTEYKKQKDGSLLIVKETLIA